jgi:hypothetical protein
MEKIEVGESDYETDALPTELRRPNGTKMLTR